VLSLYPGACAFPQRLAGSASAQDTENCLRIEGSFSRLQEASIPRFNLVLTCSSTVAASGSSAMAALIEH